MKSWQAVYKADDIQASGEILPSARAEEMQLQQEAGLTGYKNISINRKRLSIYSNLGPHIHGDGGNSNYRPPPPPPPPRTTQDQQLLMHSFGVPTNGGPWNLSRTKAGSGRSSSSWGPWCQQRIRWRWWRQQVDQAPCLLEPPQQQVDQVDTVIKLDL